MTFPDLPLDDRAVPISFDVHETALPALLDGVGGEAVAQWLHAVAKTHDAQIASLDYVLVTDEYLHAMNVERLAHDTLTDVITFDLSEGGTAFIEGECYISLPRVLENAGAYGNAAGGHDGAGETPGGVAEGGAVWPPTDPVDHIGTRVPEDQVRRVDPVNSGGARATPLSPTQGTELLRVIAHGLLHLCGLGDKRPTEAEKMRAAEDEALYIWRSRFAPAAELG